MKLEPVTRIDKRNMVTSKKFDDEVMSANPDVIVFYQFMANLQPSATGCRTHGP